MYLHFNFWISWLHDLDSTCLFFFSNCYFWQNFLWHQCPYMCMEFVWEWSNIATWILCSNLDFISPPLRKPSQLQYAPICLSHLCKRCIDLLRCHPDLVHIILKELIPPQLQLIFNQYWLCVCHLSRWVYHLEINCRNSNTNCTNIVVLKVEGLLTQHIYRDATLPWLAVSVANWSENTVVFRFNFHF